MRSAGRWVKTRAAGLNLFENEASRSNPFHLRTALISTRVYLVLLTISITALITYTSLSTYTDSFIKPNPSASDYDELFDKYSTTLSCPCNRVSIPYGSFVTILHKYHPVCSSWVVSDAWINHWFKPDISDYFQLDFRSSASGHFQLLASFCSLAKRSVEDAIENFRMNTLLSTHVVDRQTFNSNSEAQTSSMKILTTIAFRRLLDLVRSTTHSNLLQSALQTTVTNIIIYNVGDRKIVSSIGGYYYKPDGQICSCTTQLTCSLPSGLFGLRTYDNGGGFDLSEPAVVNVTGFVVGCYAVEALLQSTLECFYDQECLKIVLQLLLHAGLSVDQYNTLNQSRFSPQTSIGTLIDELFIEDWKTESLFSTYFTQCAPIACTYIDSKRSSALYILITFLSVYSGITLALRLCIPPLIAWWRSRRLSQGQAMLARKYIYLHNFVLSHFLLEGQSLAERLQQAWQMIRVKLVELNLFKTAVTLTDPFKLRTSLIATRFYLVLICVSFIILTIYTVIRGYIQSITIENPSRAIFDDLHGKYSSTLHCPCSEIAVKYGSFVSLSPRQHPVCSSLFITDAWIDSTQARYEENNTYPYILRRDFRVVGSLVFRTVAAMCSLSWITLSESWRAFNQSKLIADQTLFVDELRARTQSAFNQFKSNTKVDLKRDLSLIQAHTNELLSTFQTNVEFYERPFMSDGPIIEFTTMPVNLDTCFCAIDGDCLRAIGFWDANVTESGVGGDLKFAVPNFNSGCFIIQSTLQSTLECFFNQTCLDIIQDEIRSERSINVSILETNDTRFRPETTIGAIVDELMLEHWGETIDYDKYYEQCAPKRCSYTFTSRNSALYILTTVVGILGGVTAVLKFVVPLVVGFIRERIRPKLNTGRHSRKPKSEL